MRYAALLLALVLPAAAQAQSARPCPGFEQGPLWLTDADRFYGLRAAEILRLAMKGDRAGLAELVAPEAAVSVRYGDAGWVPSEGRRDLTGVDAIIALADRVKPRRYMATQVVSGPISIMPPKCQMSATLVVRTDEPGYAVSLSFEFEDGRVVEVHGTKIGVIEGSLP